MNIVISGAYGFVGTNLAQALSAEENYRLIALDITLIETRNQHYSDFVSWDDFPTLNNKGIDTIIHLAGKAHDTKKTASAQSYFDVNLGLTQKIFDYFIESKVEKFIFFSSVKAVADTIKKEFLTEDEIPEPKTPYGQSKLAAEQYITEKFTTWQNNNSNKSSTTKSVYIFRPAMIHGPGNKGNFNLLFNFVKKGIPWPLGVYENSRSFLSIDNLSFIIQNIIYREIKSGVYNLADDDAVSTNDIIRLMAQSMNKNHRIMKLPASMINLAAKTGDILHLPLNSERLKKLTESYKVSNEKIKQALGITELPTKAHEGLSKTFNSFRNKA